ncbi:hypothetical protein GCM10010365_21380 [Streptomyces poonensis]|uniref:Uncharacterized protein n=1 Tax=Streptomyces poonensis TaxID=68255 RepID=A0A918PER2_9ACTN|nr:hypothetical protein GCM10010365_21380 [Streptomyces poonensis]GLJ93240.1 hypothetical protein GCM10017589_58520 [Streptomyces poonensis]
MTAVVGKEISGFMTGPYRFGMAVQKYGGLYFPGVHVTEQRGLHARPFPRGLPVLGRGEKRHAMSFGGGFLHHIAQHVIAAVPVDHHQRLDAGPAQRGRYVPDDRVQGHGGDADRARPGRVLVRTGDGHRRQQPHRRIRRGDLPCDGAGDERVGGERQTRAVLLEAADGQDGHQRARAGRLCPYVLGGVRRYHVHVLRPFALTKTARIGTRS